jgi:hypothetical protein
LTSNFPLEIIDSVTLRDGLLSELLVLQMDTLFNLLDVALSFLGGLLFENFNLFIEVSLNSTFLSSKFYLILIFSLGDFVSQLVAGQLPLVDFSFVNLLFPLKLFHGGNLFLKLLDFDFTVLQFNVSISLSFLNICLIFDSSLHDSLLLGSSLLENFVSELELLPHHLSIFGCEFFNDILLLFYLSLELLNQTVILSTPK